MMLTAGDVVAADAEVAEAVQLQIDEAALTGESVPVDKVATLDPEKRRVWAGTVVTHGRGAATVTATGEDSSLGPCIWSRCEPCCASRRSVPGNSCSFAGWRRSRAWCWR
jgi:cation transport ATPase